MDWDEEQFLPLRFHPLVACLLRTYHQHALNNVLAHPLDLLLALLKHPSYLNSLTPSPLFPFSSRKVFKPDLIGNVPQCLAMSCLRFLFEIS
jgi:hypothetical protein